MPVSVSLRFDPVSASGTGKTLIAFNASAGLTDDAGRPAQPTIVGIPEHGCLLAEPGLTRHPPYSPTSAELARAGACRVLFFRLPTSGQVEHVSTSCWERTPVAAVCDVCGKRPGFGHNVPWSKKKTNRRWNPNIQRVPRRRSGSAQAAKRLHLVHQGRAK